MNLKKSSSKTSKCSKYFEYDTQNSNQRENTPTTLKGKKIRTNSKDFEYFDVSEEDFFNSRSRTIKVFVLRLGGDLFCFLCFYAFSAFLPY